MSSAFNFQVLSRQLTQDFYEADKLTSGLLSVTSNANSDGENDTLIALVDSPPQFIKCSPGLSIAPVSLDVESGRELTSVASYSLGDSTLYVALENSNAAIDESALLWSNYSDGELSFNSHGSASIPSDSNLWCTGTSAGKVIVFVDTLNKIYTFDPADSSWHDLTYDTRSLNDGSLMSVVELDDTVHFIGLCHSGFFYTIATLYDGIPSSVSSPVEVSISSYRPTHMASVVTENYRPWAICVDDQGKYKWYQPGDSNTWNSIDDLFLNTPVDGIAVESIMCTTDGDNFTLYIVTTDKVLWTATGTGDPSNSITSPLPHTQGIEHGSPIAGEKGINVFTLQGLCQFIRNSDDDNWEQTPVTTPSLNLYERTTYRTQIQVSDGNGNLQVKQTMNIWTDHPGVAEINGQTVYLSSDHDHPCQVDTDQSGILTLVTDADGLYSRQFYLTAGDESFQDHSPITPDKPIVDKLKTLTADDLDNATDQVSGELLFSNPDLPKNDIAGAVSSIANSPIVNPSGNNKRIVKRKLSKGNSGGGENAYGGTWQFGEPAASYPKQRSLIEVDWGGVWQSIASGVTSSLGVLIETVGGVINATVNFIINGIEYQFSGVIAFFEDAIQLIQTIFKSIGATVENIINWLGTVFNWDDIKLTAQAIMDNVDNIIDRSESAVDSLLTSASDYVDQAQQRFDNNITEYISNVLGSSDWLTQYQSTQNQESQTENMVATKFIQNSDGITLSSNNLDQGPQSLSEILTGFYDAVKDNFGEDFQNQFLAILDSEADFISQLASAIALVMEAFADTAFAAAKTALAALQTILDAIMESIRALLTYEIDIPILSTLFKTKTGFTLTLGNLVSLLLAVPVTVVYKLATGEAPFANSNDVNAYGQFLNSPSQSDARRRTSDADIQRYAKIAVACDSVTVGITAATETVLDMAIAAEVDSNWVTLVGATASTLEIVNLGVGFPFAGSDGSEPPTGPESALWCTEVLCRTIDLGWAGYSIIANSGSPALRYAPKIGAVLGYTEGSVKLGLICGIYDSAPPANAQERRLFAAVILGIVSDFTKCGVIPSVAKETGGVSVAATAVVDCATLLSAAMLLAWSVQDAELLPPPDLTA